MTLLLLAEIVIQGQILFSLPRNQDATNHLFVLEGDFGRTVVHTPKCKDFLPGDFVTVRTSEPLENIVGNWFIPNEITVTGHAPLPPFKPESADRIKAGRCNLELIQVQGTIVDVFHDEIDEEWNWLLLRSNGITIPLAWSGKHTAIPHLANLIGAEVRADGCSVPLHRGRRHFMPALVELRDLSDLHIITPPKSTPFDVPPASLNSSARSAERQRIDGTVTAAWGKNRVFILTDDCIPIQIRLRRNISFPAIGERIRVSGFAETDNFYLQMTQSIWRPEPGDVKPEPAPRPLVPGSRFDPDLNGLPVSIHGTIEGLPTAHVPDRFVINCSGQLISIIFNRAETTPDIPLGSKVLVTGICLMEFDASRAETEFPRITGSSVIIRTPEDVQIRSTPSWWTPSRLLAVIGGLLTILIGIILWNVSLNRRAHRKGRELATEQLAHVTSELKVYERTRLAVELHDSLSQTLTGVSMELNTAGTLAGERIPGLQRHIGLATKALDACRVELRHCLWDLRSEALEEPDLNKAIRLTLCQDLNGIRISIRFNVSRDRLSDNTAHAILRIIRELVTNAIRHGKATSIRIAGSIEDDHLLFSVKDNGHGFDPDNRPGLSEGHFGLQGIEERVERLDGEVTIDSSPNHGTRIAVSIPIPNDEKVAR